MDRRHRRGPPRPPPPPPPPAGPPPPFGELKGMAWDPIKKRYYAVPASLTSSSSSSASASASASSSMVNGSAWTARPNMGNMRGRGRRDRDRGRQEEVEDGETEIGSRSGISVRVTRTGTGRRNVRFDGSHQDTLRPTGDDDNHDNESVRKKKKKIACENAQSLSSSRLAPRPASSTSHFNTGAVRTRDQIRENYFPFSLSSSPLAHRSFGLHLRRSHTSSIYGNLRPFHECPGSELYYQDAYLPAPLSCIVSIPSSCSSSSTSTSSSRIRGRGRGRGTGGDTTRTNGNPTLVGDVRGSITAIRYEYNPETAPRSIGDEQVERTWVEAEAEAGEYGAGIVYQSGGGGGRGREVKTRKDVWEDGRRYWVDYDLGSKITSIHASSTTYTALSFGPVPRLVLSPIPPVMLDSFGLFPSPSEDQDRPTVLWELTKLRDGWSMDTTLGRGEVAGSGGAGERDPVGGNAILIGGNKQMMYAKDLANPTFESVKVHSDVLSVAMINVNEAIVGLRSSQIMHYDFRQPLSKSGSVRGSLSKSVTNIQVFDESSSGVGFGGGRGLLAGGMGNELSFLDMRFATAQPVTRYGGHVNDCRIGLGLTRNPSSSAIFAAGSDCRLRSWNLLDGSSITSIHSPDEAISLDPLNKLYDSPISGLEMQREGVLSVLNGRKVEVYAVNRDLLVYGRD